MHDEIVNSACIARSLHSKTPRRIRTHDVTLQDAVNYDVAIAGRHPFCVESGTRQSLGDVGPLMQLNKCRKYLFPRSAEKK